VKSLEQSLHSLIRASGGDGNLLYSVGPMADGRIEPLQVERLKEMGQWLRQYGYAIYETRGGPFKPTDWGVSTRKENKIYLHILKWSGNSPKITLPDIGMRIKKCTLAGGGKVKHTIVNGENIIEFNGDLLQPINTIVEIEVEGNAMDIKPMDVAPQSLSYMKKVSGSSNLTPKWIEFQWTDIQSVTNGDWVGDFWLAEGTDKNPWLEINLGAPSKVGKAIIYESGKNIKSFELQYKSENKWNTIYKGTTVGAKAEISFKPIDVQVVRLAITSFSGTPGIYEISLLKE